jgi:hypothetical protein
MKITKKLLNRKKILTNLQGSESGRKSEREGKREILLIGWHHITWKKFVLNPKLNDSAI